MDIYFLGWGSLIWDKERELKTDSDWKLGGPVLKIEFSRVSSDGRLTLVIDRKNGSNVSTYFAKSVRNELEEAIADLMTREGTVKRMIGFVDLINNSSSLDLFPNQPDVFDSIKDWCKQRGYKVVVWTALDSQFEEKVGKKYSPTNALKYLRDLPEPKKVKAKEYIKRAPVEVETEFRKLFNSVEGF